MGSFIPAKVAEFKSIAPGAVSVTNLLYAMTVPLHWGLAAIVIFVLGTTFVMQSKNFLPKFLPPGTEVIFVTGLATLFSVYCSYDGAVVGNIPQVDPDAGLSFLDGRIRLPVDFLSVQSLIYDIPETLLARFGGSYILLATSAALFAAVNFLSIMGIASGFEAEDGIPWSADREMIAHLWQSDPCYHPYLPDRFRRFSLPNVTPWHVANDRHHIAALRPSDRAVLDLSVTIHEYYVSYAESSLECGYHKCRAQVSCVSNWSSATQGH
jgi:hypothetical protein